MQKIAAANLDNVAAGNMCAVQLETLAILMSHSRIQCDMHGRAMSILEVYVENRVAITSYAFWLDVVHACIME